MGISREDLKSFLTDDMPLGPLQSESIEDENVFRILFDEDSAAYKFDRPNPSIVIGRRGSGKTGYLMNQIMAKRDSVSAVLLKTQDSFRTIIEAIESEKRETSLIPVETISEQWLIIIYYCAIHELSKTRIKSGLSGLFQKFLDAFGDLTGAPVGELLVRVADRIRTSKRDGLSSDVLSALLSGVSRNVASLKTEIEDECRSQGRICIVMIDTLEDYNLHYVEYQKAIAGLLKAVGTFNVEHKGIQVRLTLPGELHRSIETYSTNRTKDLSHMVALQWHAGDLVSLAAQRFNAYLYARGYIDTDIEESVVYLSNRNNALSFFDNILPNNFRNGFNKLERPIAYILRHTQLLPRQMLYFLQELVLDCQFNGVHPNQVTSDCLMRSLKKVEQHLVKEVCQGFAFVHPDAFPLVEFLRIHLQRLFSENDFQKAFTDFSSRYAILKPRYYEALNALINIGAVGRVISESETYIEGHFEYVGRSDVQISAGSKFCIHPLFNGKPWAELQTNHLTGVPVYPYGSDPYGSTEVV